MQKAKTRLLNIEKAGTVQSTYGYSFGEHLWTIKISYTMN
jgi:hypothetical protein